MKICNMAVGVDKHQFFLYTVRTSERPMTTPNWQHHSKKDAKRTLKPQALRQAKARRQALKRHLEAIR